MFIHREQKIMIDKIRELKRQANNIDYDISAKKNNVNYLINFYNNWNDERVRSYFIAKAIGKEQLCNNILNEINEINKLIDKYNELSKEIEEYRNLFNEVANG